MPSFPRRRKSVRPTAHSNSEVEVLAVGTATAPVPEPNCVAARRGGEQGEGKWWPLGKEMTNMIRPSEQASMRIQDEARTERCRFMMCVGACKCHGLVARCLMKGRCEVAVCGLGRPVGKSGVEDTPAGVRGSIVAMRPVKVGGAKGDRKLDWQGSRL